MANTEKVSHERIIDEKIESFLVQDESLILDQYNEIIEKDNSQIKSKLTDNKRNIAIHAEFKHTSNKKDAWNERINLKNQYIENGYDSMEDDSCNSDEDDIHFEDIVGEIKAQLNLTKDGRIEVMESIPTQNEKFETDTLDINADKLILDEKEDDIVTGDNSTDIIDLTEGLDEDAALQYDDEKISALFDDLIVTLKYEISQSSFSIDKDVLNAMGLKFEHMADLRNSGDQEDESVEIQSPMNIADTLKNAKDILDLFPTNDSLEYFNSEEFIQDTDKRFGEIRDLNPATEYLFPFEAFIKKLDKDNDLIASEWYKKVSDGKFIDDIQPSVVESKEENESEPLFKEELLEETEVKLERGFIQEKPENLFDQDLASTFERNTNFEERIKKLAKISTDTKNLDPIYKNATFEKMKDKKDIQENNYEIPEKLQANDSHFLNDVQIDKECIDSEDFEDRLHIIEQHRFSAKDIHYNLNET